MKTRLFKCSKCEMTFTSEIRLQPADFERMLKMSLADIARFLEENEYQQEINELGALKASADLLELALSRNLENTFSKLIKLALKGPRLVLLVYLQKWDIWNIKSILRGKQSGASFDDIQSTLVAGGQMERAVLEKVARDAHSVGDAIELLKISNYYPVLKEHENNLTALEDALDTLYYHELLAIPDKEVHDFVRTQIGVLNTLNAHRAENASVNKVEVEPKKGKKINVSSKEDLAIRKELLQLVISKGIRLLHQYTFSAAPLIGYCVAKENEIRNLRILVRGKKTNLDETLIQKQWVML